MTICTQPLLESLFSARLGHPVRAGEVVQTPVDLVMAHDATLSLLIEDFERLGQTIRFPERFMVTCDHFAPPARIDWANLQREVLAFVRRHDVPDLRMYQGICHQLLLEDPRLLPGTVTVGADSHTLLAGAVGGFATGLGATDILAVLATGETWFQVPASVQIRLTGRRKPWVMGRDVAFHLLGHFGEDGAGYRALELWDDTDDGLSMDARAAITCMSTEMGAKAALFAPDATTRAFLTARDGRVPEMPLPPRPSDTVYIDAMTIDVGALDSLVACPFSPANVHPVREVEPVPLDEVYIGSCAGGRLEDLALAARMLAGRQVARGLKVIAVPSSVSIMQAAMAAGYLQTLLDAGVCVSNPSCGACGGIDKGVLAAGDRALMTSTRNFRGRLGPRDSEVYLASTATAAASALTGRLTAPEEVWPC
jgi:3-isopropylmalate/(R)-2-methylmalate dehydratase large subunit